MIPFTIRILSAPCFGADGRSDSESEPEDEDEDVKSCGFAGCVDGCVGICVRSGGGRVWIVFSQ